MLRLRQASLAIYKAARALRTTRLDLG